MTLFGSFLGIITFFVAIGLGKPRLQLTIALLSLLSSDFAVDFFGSKLPFHHLIGIWWLVSIKGGQVKLLNPILNEYALLLLTGVYFVWLSPWNDPYEMFKPWNQQLAGRFTTAMFKLFFELAFLYGSYKYLERYKLSLKKISSLVVNMSVVLVLIALFDFLFLNYTVRNILFHPVSSDNSRLFGRLLGFCHEPKAFARSLIFPLVILVSTRQKIVSNNNLKFMLILVAFLLTFSVSGYLTFTAGFITLLIVSKKTYKSNFETRFVLVLLGLILVSLSSLLTLDILAGVRYKLNYVLADGANSTIYNGEPLIFTRFEVFDRATLNFFYLNPIYLLIGTGPNLISIPASPFITSSARQVLGDYLVGGPTMGFLTIMARSGLFGCILYLRFFYKVLGNKYRDIGYRHTVIMMIPMFLMNTLSFVPFFMLAIATNAKRK